MEKQINHNDELGLGVKLLCENCQKFRKKEISQDDKTFISEKIKNILSVRERIIYKLFKK